MLDVFGSKGIASEVLSGKRELSKAHIQRLSEKFHVSPGLFFWPVQQDSRASTQIPAAKKALPQEGLMFVFSLVRMRGLERPRPFEH
jgi:hypothetical protein